MKHARFPRFATTFGPAAILAVCVAVVPAASKRADAQAPPAPPPNPNATPSSLISPPAATPLPSGAPVPSSSPSPQGRRRGRNRAPGATATSNPEPTSTPTSPAFATLDGTWEVQVQHMDRTDYSYFDIKQSGTSELSGFWRVEKQRFPFEGSYDGRLIRIVVREPTRNVTLSGYVEGASDMVGLVDSGVANVDGTPFTAEHRAAHGSAPVENVPKKH